jgi:hypothetical protein
MSVNQTTVPTERPTWGVVVAGCNSEWATLEFDDEPVAVLDRSQMADLISALAAGLNFLSSEEPSIRCIAFCPDDSEFDDDDEDRFETCAN